MLVIKNDLSSSCTIKKSKFLAYLYNVSSKAEVLNKLDSLKKDNPSAKHMLYAYLLENGEKAAFEDREPVHAAHKILEGLATKGVGDILCAVVRYYGGIELGAANLERTYIHCVFNLLNANSMGQKVWLGIYQGEIKTACYKPAEKEINSLHGRIISSEFAGPKASIVFSCQYLSPLLASFFASCTPCQGKEKTIV